MKGDIDASAHTFYEWKFPLSLLGVTADYIRNTGIGVQYLDVYGSSPVGGTPYDPAFFDNASDSYSQDPSSSKEKEDEDIITYAPARIGKLKASSGIGSAVADKTVRTDVKIVAGGVSLSGLNGEMVIVAGIDGKVYHNAAVNGSLNLSLNPGVYVVNVDGKGTRVLVK